MPRTDNSGLLSTIFRVPPNLIFGIPTQLACPIDTFVTLDSDMRMKGVQLRSRCVDVNIGMFQYNGIQLIHTLSVVGSVDDYDYICVSDDLINDDTRVYLRSTFSSNSDSLQLGYFMVVRPDDNLNAMSTAFFRNNAIYTSKISRVEFMLFGTQFTTEVLINQDGLSFSANCNIFNSYPVQLTGTAPQDSEWNGLPIEITSQFSTGETNIPHLLQHEIHQYVSYIAGRARLSEQSALLSLQRARAQFELVNNTYQTRLQNYEAICSEYADAMTELENATTEQAAAQQAVDLAEDVLREARDRFNNLCEIQVCNDICVPGTVCEECTATVSSTIQGTCSAPCQLTETVRRFVTVRAYSCWRWINQLQCVYLCYCPSWSICVAGRACRYVSVCARTTCYKDIYETVDVTYTGTCVTQCDVGIMSTDVVEQCCSLSDCSSQIPDSNCVRMNSKCQMARDLAYAQLERSESSLYEPLERLDAARQRISSAQINVARLRSEKSIAEQLLNQSRTAYTATQESVGYTEMVYQYLVAQINESLILANILDEMSGDIVQVETVQFTVTVITESPTSIPVTVTYSFPLLGTTHTDEIILDFEYIETSLMQRAIDLTNGAFNLVGRRRKRQAEDDTVTGQRDISQTAMYYGEKCTDIRNLHDYIDELVNSLKTIANVSQASQDAVMENVIALGNLSADSTNNNTSSVNVTYLEMEFGVAVNMTETTNNEASEITDLLDNLQSLTSQLAASIGENSFAEWQVKMEDLHNQTGSAGGHPCFGFSDCLVTIGEITGNLLRLTPLPEATILLANLHEAESDLIDLAIQTNLTIDEAISRTDKILVVFEELLQLNYWCALEPNITVQPEERIATPENNTVVISCEAESMAPINYKWKKGSVDVPGANSSTLVLQNIKFSDAENYTCIATNHIGSVTSINSSVEVQELPAFFLQPSHQDIYLRDQNGAQFKCNATGFPYPGFRWYRRLHNETEFTVVPGEDENEYTIPNTVPEHEGVYYCEAYNEQGTVQSRQVNLTILRTSVAQLARYFTMNMTTTTNGSIDEVVEEASNLTLGSGTMDAPQDALIQHFITVVNNSINLQQTTIENVIITPINDMSFSITFGLYSNNIRYTEENGNNLLAIGPQARTEWGIVHNELVGLLRSGDVIISDGLAAYQTSSSSLQMGDIQFACPPGSAIYEDNQFLCGE